MRKIALLLSICFSQLTFAQIDTLTLSSKISDVTVFFSGAQVTRTVKTNIKLGKHLILIDRLPLEINPQSIQVKGTDDLQILSVKHQTNYKDQGKKTPAVEAIYEKIEAQKVEMRSIGNQIEVQDIEEKFLISNSDISNKDKNISIEQLSNTATFYRERLNKIKRKKLELTVQLKDMQEQLEDYYQTLNKLVVKDRKTYSQILVTVECKKYTNKTISLSYLVESAGWEPLYDFRVQSIALPLKVVYNANIYQSTGEDWKDVNVTLSSGNPTETAEIPTLKRYYVGREQQTVRQLELRGAAAITGRVFDAQTGDAIPFANVSVFDNNNTKQLAITTTDLDGQYTIKPIPPGRYAIKVTYVGFQPETKQLSFSKNVQTFSDFALNRGVELQEVKINAEPQFELDQTTISSTVTRQEISKMAVRSVAGNSNVRGQRNGSEVTFIDGVKLIGNGSVNLISNSLKKAVAQLEYKIDIPYTILSDGEDYNLKIKEVSLDADYEYFAIPKLDPDAFLTASLSDWGDLNLLSGEASIFYEGTFTASYYLDVENAEDTLSISLGRDKDIYLKRELDKGNYEKKGFGKNVKETLAWKIVVKNNKSVPIKLTIEDQYALTDRDIYKAELLESVGAEVNADSGKLTWELQLNAAEKKELNFKYYVQYPKY
jgi:hypothetical protein